MALPPIFSAMRSRSRGDPSTLSITSLSHYLDLSDMKRRSGFQETFAMKPDHPEAHNNLAHSLQMLGRNEQALAHYEKALAIEPGYVEARNNLGAMLQTLGRLAEAVPHYETALAARPNYAPAHKNWAMLWGD